MKMHVIASGSKGNASVIYDENTMILIDMGVSKECLFNGLAEIGKKISDINYALFTHNHSDHIRGAIYLLDNIKYCREGTLPILKTHILELFHRYYFGNFVVTPLLTSHDAAAPCGFLFENNDEKLSYLTDTGYIPEETLKLIINCDYYFMESNHDVEMLIKSSRPQILKNRILSDLGHLSNEQSAKYMVYLVGNKTKAIMLAHLSEECNTPELALAAYKRIFQNEGVSLKGINLSCAKQWESEDLI